MFESIQLHWLTVLYDHRAFVLHLRCDLGGTPFEMLVALPAVSSLWLPLGAVAVLPSPQSLCGAGHACRGHCRRLEWLASLSIPSSAARGGKRDCGILPMTCRCSLFAHPSPCASRMLRPITHRLRWYCFASFLIKMEVHALASR